jgi:hypothetical protein
MTATTVEHTAHLAPISLEELVAEAGLLTRVDRKYVVPLDAAHRLLQQAPPDARVLEIEGRREFGYLSTYLDTPERHSYLSAGRSHRRRWKVRSRAYLDSGGSWLEVKTRGSRGRTVKERILHPDPAQGEGLTAEGRSFVGERIGVRRTDALHPVLDTSYRRTTLFLPSSASRMTVDTDLTWASRTNGRTLQRPALAIVETKTGSTPSSVDRLLWSHGHRPIRISKYGVGMAAVHPDLPRLKWHRALDRHLDLPRTNSVKDAS